jgi:hypothetical protein
MVRVISERGWKIRTQGRTSWVVNADVQVGR